MRLAGLQGGVILVLLFDCRTRYLLKKLQTCTPDGLLNKNRDLVFICEEIRVGTKTSSRNSERLQLWILLSSEFI